MSIQEFIKDAERRNNILMEDIERGNYSIESAAINSDNIFIQVIKVHILYANEAYNFDAQEKENKAIVKQLIDGDISPEEAATQSNSVWIDCINKLRNPGEVKLNIANYRSLPAFIINH